MPHEIYRPAACAGAALLLSLTLLGCASAAKGSLLFREAGCVRCHIFRGVGNKGIGPDLSEVRGRRTPGWIAEQIEDPRRHNPLSRRPGFGSLSASQRESLVLYLTEKP